MKPKTQSEARSHGLEGRLEGRLVMEGHLKICWRRAYLISTPRAIAGIAGPLLTATPPTDRYNAGGGRDQERVEDKMFGEP